MLRTLALLILLAFGLFLTIPETATAAPPETVPAMHTAVDAGHSGFDPVAATNGYMARLSGEARAKSDGYQEGEHWLILWNLLLTLLISGVLLATGWSARLRAFAERTSARPNLQVLIYALSFIVITALMSFPLSIYEGFVREHHYGMSNQGFADWVGESLTALAVDLVLMGLAITGLYAILRRVPRTWWAWGTLASAGFICFMIMINPVFITPLFNTYTPLPDGEVRTEIMALARANAIPTDTVYVFDASKQTKRISANVSGLFGTTRIALNDNLLNRTSLPEIRAVMAHEMGHYVLNHGLKHAIAFSLLMLAGFLFLRYSWDWACARWGKRCGVRDITDPAGLPLFSALLSVFFFLATPVSNLIIRTAEIEADLYGLNASREADGFAEGIFKLAEYRKLQPGALEELVFYHHPSGYNRILTAMRWKAENLK